MNDWLSDADNDDDFTVNIEDLPQFPVDEAFDESTFINNGGHIEGCRCSLCGNTTKRGRHPNGCQCDKCATVENDNNKDTKENLREAFLNITTMVSGLANEAFSNVEGYRPITELENNFISVSGADVFVKYTGNADWIEEAMLCIAIISVYGSRAFTLWSASRKDKTH